MDRIKLYSSALIVLISFMQIVFCQNPLKVNSSENIENDFNIINNYNDKLCENKMTEIFEGIKNFTSGKETEVWILDLVDSWGKMPTGIISGHLKELGNFEQCLKYQTTFAESQANFHGQYCTAVLPLDIVRKLFQSRSSSENLELLLSFGVCVPDVCSIKLLEKIFKKFLLDFKGIHVKSEIFANDSCTRNDKIHFDALDIVAIVIFSSVGLMMLLSTIYDYVKRTRSEQPQRGFIAFSVLSNGEKLFKMSTHQSPDTISCLNGMRSLSMMWVVLAHAYDTYKGIGMLNYYDYLKWFQTPFAALFVFGTVAVDTFFVLSGLLVAWSAFRMMQKTKGKLNIPMIYIHRYLRLTPVLAAAVLFSASLCRHIGSGPAWKWHNDVVTPPCQEYWWSTMLYIQNYVNNHKTCLPQTWYISADTQLFFLSPLVIIPLWKWGKKAFLPIILLALCSNAAVFTLFMIYDYSTIKYREQIVSVQDERMDKTYLPTHVRYAPWLVGILLGYFMHENRNNKCTMSKITVTIGWTLSVGTILAVLFGPYHRVPDGVELPTRFESATYEALSKTAWAVALSWIIFACHKGYGGIANSMLSWPIWEPFSRLTYSNYIVHFLLQYLVVGNMKNDQHFSDFDIICKFWVILD